MKNQELATIFYEIADALEVKGEQPFRVLAYRRAARAIESLAEDIATLAAENRLQKIPGIGEGIARKVVEYLTTGKMQKHSEALAGLSEGLLELLKIPGMGPKTVALAHKELGVQSLEDLKRVIADGSLARLPGMGEKKLQNLLQGIALREQTRSRLPLAQATAVADEVVGWLKSLPEIVEAIPAGSLRRGKETIGDIDILVTGPEPEPIIRHFTGFPGVSRVIAAGETKASVVLGTGSHAVQVDLRVLPETSYGAALQYFTGSKEHNVKLRTLARQQGLKISEYGVFRGKKRIASRTEQEVYAALKMAVPPPELREDQGEIEAALSGTLPELITLGDIRGDLHSHTDWSDGVSSLAEMAAAAQARGYQYLAITEHSQAAAYAQGLTIERLRQAGEAIDRLNRHLKGFRLLKGAEVDILPDGRLDYPDEVLAGLDIVIASVHQGFRSNVTERLCAALANPYVDIVAHPSGRLISRRQGYEVDLEKVLACARRYGKILELNACPERLDLNEHYLRKAQALGISIVISTDAHSPVELDWMRFGVTIARRGWLEKPTVLNTRPLKALLDRLKRSSR